MAILSVIVVVSSEDFWMMPDAGWRGAMKVSKSLADVKPSCTVERPLLEILSEDFDATIGNLKWLQDQTATHGFHVKKGLLVGHPGDEPAHSVPTYTPLFLPLYHFPSVADTQPRDAPVQPPARHSRAPLALVDPVNPSHHRTGFAHGMYR